MKWLLLLFCLVAYASQTEDFSQTAAFAAYEEGKAALAAGDLPAAEKSFQRAILFDGTYAEAHLALGITYFEKKNYKQALRRLKTAVVFDAQLIQAWDYLGRTYESLQDPKTALKTYLQGVFCDPNFSLQEARFGGRLEERALGDDRRLEELQTLQQADSIQNKVIYVVNDTPTADTIVLARFLKALQARGARVLFEPGKELEQLFRLGMKIGIVDWLTLSGDVQYDYRIGLSALPLYFTEQIPYADGYLTAVALPDAVVAQGKKVGVIWRFDAEDPAAKSTITLQTVLSHISNGEIYLLQPAPRDIPPKANVLGMRGQSFADTASLIAAMDEIVGVDCVETRIAAAMGKKTTILLPKPNHWLWMETGDTTVWFSSTNLAR